ncbi:MAG: polyhydroxyalkanoate synthesis regulator phasin [Bacteriovoracaceae bacterium]|jgi:polyhydroxyalkanoate synthesis regulator phasin
MTKKDEKEGLGDVIKKVVSIGVGAAFMTEEAVRGIVKDLPLPKEIVTGLIENAKGARTEFTAGIQEEVRKHLSKVDPKQMLETLLDGYDIEVKANLSFKKKDEAKDGES